MIDVIFGDYRSFTDFGLVLEDMDIPPASPKTNYVDIPGGDGSIDLTEAFGEVKYNDRELEFAFSCRKEDFETKKRIVANAIHGKRMRVSTTVDPGYYYQGRVYIDSYETSAVFGRIIVKAIVEPYKYHGEKVSQRISAPGAGTVTNGGIKAVIPDIITPFACDVEVNGVKANLPRGRSRYMGFSINPGDNSVAVSNVSSVLSRPYTFEDLYGSRYVLDVSGFYVQMDVDQDGSVKVGSMASKESSVGQTQLVELHIMGDLDAGVYELDSFDIDGAGYEVEYAAADGTTKTVDDMSAHDGITMDVAQGGYIKISVKVVGQQSGQIVMGSFIPTMRFNGAKVTFEFLERDL